MIFDNFKKGIKLNGFNPLYLGELKQKNELQFYNILDKVYETRNTKLFYDFIETYKNN